MNMDFDKYWESLKKKNPGLADDDTTMKISVKSLRESLKQAFNAGKESSYRNGSAFDRMFGGGIFK